MLEVKTRLVAPALMALAGIALVGCSASQDGPKYPPPPTAVATAKFSSTTGDLPYPADPFFFVGTTDGTLNLPTIAFRPASNQAALNALDGWSTSATLSTGFTLPIDPATLNGSTVKIVKVYLNPTNKAPVDVTNPTQVASYLPTGWPLAQGPIAGVLAYGTDYTASVDDSIDSGNKFLKITPLKPFDFSKGPAVTGGKVFNIGYIVILTNGIKSTDGQAMGSDTQYAAIKADPSAACGTISDATQKLICQFTKPQLSIAQAIGVNPANVILSWSFSTQSIDDTFAYLAATSTPQQTLVVPTGLTTRDVSASLAGKAFIYVGSTKLPYYLTPPANPNDRTSIMSKYWTAASGPNPAFGLDPTSRNLTMFNWVPAKVADVTVPLLVTIPKIGAGGSACPGMPAGGWPVAIVQHGITGNRSQALAMADSFADACFIVAAIDLPLHGITDTTNPLYCTPAKPQCIGATERTFDIDIMNNTTGKAGPDGKIDPAAGVGGSTYLNLESPLTGRDNLRQGETDLTVFTKSVAGLAIAPNPALPAGGPVGVDASRISFVGLSMGAIVGGAHVHFSNDTRTATLAVPGGVITRLGLDSPTFGPPITAAVGANLPPGSYLFNLFFRDIQAVIDSGDPINHIKDAQTMHPLHLIKVLNDTVVPNSATDRLIVAAPLRKLKTIGPNAVGPGTGAYTFFTKGSHGSLFDPTASPAATAEMQKQTVLFAASAIAPGGPFVTLTDPTVLDLN